MRVTQSAARRRTAALALCAVCLAVAACGADPTGVAPPGSVYSSVTTGAEHTCGLAPDGGVFCWGAGERGELGDSLIRSSSRPVRVRLDRTVLAVSSGGSHSCAVTREHEVFCWGWNTFGQLGLGTRSNQGVPVRVSPDRQYRAVSAGWYHSCALTETGAAYCWGRNGQGQLGNGDTADSAVPVPVAGSLRFSSITAGGFHSCGVTATGAAHCWGLNHMGQLGTGDGVSGRVPRAVAGNLRFTKVSAGVSHSCGIAREQAYCWGSSTHGELGTGVVTGPLLPGSMTPAAVPGIDDAVLDISAGLNISCAAARSWAYCWGRGDSGQLGLGSHWDAARPQRLPDPSPVQGLTAGSIEYRGISARGLRHACGIGRLGDVYCWGEGGSGQLGTGGASSPVPQRVLGERR